MILGLCLAVYHIAVYRPLTRATAEIDLPLTKAWRELLNTSPLAGELDAGYGERIAAGLAQARDTGVRLEALKATTLKRIEPDPAIRARMGRPFQLIEFQGERQVRLEALSGLAAKQKVGLGRGVEDGFPEYTAGRRSPSLLWPQLLVAHHVVAAALQSRVTTVSVVRLPPIRFHAGTNSGDLALVEIPAQIELEGTAGAVAQFLEGLPLQPEEIKARGLPEAGPEKPVLFIRSVLLRKVARERPDQTRLELGVSGFVTAPRGELD